MFCRALERLKEHKDSKYSLKLNFLADLEFYHNFSSFSPFDSEFLEKDFKKDSKKELNENQMCQKRVCFIKNPLKTPLLIPKSIDLLKRNLTTKAKF